MSSYLNIYLRNKKTKEKISLFWLSTTPARELYEVVPYTANKEDFYAPFTKQLYDDVCNFYDEEVKNWENYIKNNNEHIAVLEKRIEKSSQELYSVINDEINDYINSNNESKKEIENLKYYKSLFNFAYNALEDNNDYSEDKGNYELIYSLD